MLFAPFCGIITVEVLIQLPIDIAVSVGFFVSKILNQLDFNPFRTQFYVELLHFAFHFEPPRLRNL